MTSGISEQRLQMVKLILWSIVGVWFVVTISRFAHGLGVTSGLNDAAPWGFWIAFDVMAGVALAAGGFVVAAIVYIFGVERYHHYARPAILTALLGYMAVAVGLLYDLGIPWHIWHPMIMPQHHSVLFEVAMCVMCYLTVLALEFSPAVLEHPIFHRPFFRGLLTVVKKLTIPLVIAGIVLSTLHQSSLGSLFLIQPFRVHPLWYSPYLYALFFVSAVGLGLMMVTLESLCSSWLFGHKVDVGGLSGLGKLASLVLGVYVVFRLADLVYRGILPGALDGSWQAWLFLVELAWGAIVPAMLLVLPPVRRSIAGLATCAVMGVTGIVWHRFNVCIIAFERPDALGYWPTWIELAVSAGIVAGAILVFIFFNEQLKIGHAPVASPTTFRERFNPSLRRHSLAFVLAASVAVALLPADAVYGPTPQPAPVMLARNVSALATEAPKPRRLDFHVASFAATVPADVNPIAIDVLLIDGNRNWRYVPFTHERHIETYGGEESCKLCHHQRMTFDEHTACYQCHRDMYEPTDIFDHRLHVDRLGESDACTICHSRDWHAKSREKALACWECHGDMVVPGSLIPPHESGLQGIAPSYMDAMHGLCITCHERLALENPEKYTEVFGRCDVCHRDTLQQKHRELAPYVPMPPDHRNADLYPDPTPRTALETGAEQ